MSDNTELIAKARKAIFPWEPELCVDVVHALEASTVQLAAAQAVIAKAKSWNDHDTGEPSYWDLHHVLAQSPIDALAAHDRQVAAKALEEAAYEWGEGTWQDVWAGDGVDDDVTAVQSTVRWLRARAAVYRSTVKGEGN